MTASDFDKIDNTYYLIEENTKNMCKQNNIEFYHYLGYFTIILKGYIESKKLINTIEKLDFSNPSLIKATLNKATYSTKINELKIAKEDFEKARLELFDWLDKTITPYFYILNPIYKFGSGIDYNSYFSKRDGYIKIPFTGVQNLDIAIDYTSR